MVKIIQVDSVDFPCTDVLFQTSFWGKVKEECSGQVPYYFWVTAQFQSDEAENSASQYNFPLLVILRRTKGGTVYAYAQRAPAVNISEEFRGLLLEDIAENLTEFLPSETAFIRFDLPWPSYSRKNQGLRTELLELSMNFGTRTHNLRKAPSNYLCPNTIIIDLHFPPEKLLGSMRQQTRNSVRRAYREEVEFSIFDAASPDLEEKLHSWHEIYVSTAKRKNFFYEEIDYFRTIFKIARNWPEICRQNRKKSAGAGTSFRGKDSANSLVPMDAQVPPPKFYLFTAHKNECLLSGLILAVCGKTAYYMYAASSLEGRECMPNYGLQWEVIRFARSLGCTQYDLMGIPPNSDGANFMAGLYIFKTGFGGRKACFGGTWDFPYKQNEYSSYRISETLQMK